jgi:formylglycine-generating enzyme required for sulfatase activity
MTLGRLCGLLLAVVLAGGEGAAQLPPDMEADRYLVEAERHIETGDQAAAQAALDRILALQAAHDLALPEAFWFQYAQVASQAGLYGAAVEAATRYLTTVEREGAHYRAALELLDQAAAARHRIEAERQAQLADEAAYAEAQRVDTAAAYSAYLAAHPRGRYATEARASHQARAETERLAQLPCEIRNSLGMEFVLLEAGTFQMGSPATESGRDATRPCTP